jgi:hypothetical protein
MARVSNTDPYSNQVVVRPNEISFSFNARTDAPISRLVLNEVGVLQQLVWDPANLVWNDFGKAPKDICDEYAKCGAFGLCNVRKIITMTMMFCSCVVGFSPVNPS